VRDKNRSLFPLFLMLVGLIFIVSASFWFYNSTRSENPASNIPSKNIPYPEVIRISPKDAKAAFDLKNAIFIDVRGSDIYQQGHIPGALSIPLSDISGNISGVNPTDWIIPYCT
jgi:3-mercaptopyruvate sulfurtransferase SseA